KYLTLLFLCAACASVPRDTSFVITPPSAADDPQAVAMLKDGELTSDKAVAVAMLHNPRLQVTLAELGVARADLMKGRTISNPVFEAESRLPADPFHAYEFRLAQSLVELIQLPRRRAIGRAAFDAAQLRVASEVLRFGGDVRIAYVN